MRQKNSGCACGACLFGIASVCREKPIRIVFERKVFFHYSVRAKEYLRANSSGLNAGDDKVERAGRRHAFRSYYRTCVVWREQLTSAYCFSWVYLTLPFSMRLISFALQEGCYQSALFYFRSLARSRVLLRLFVDGLAYWLFEIAPISFRKA